MGRIARAIRNSLPGRQPPTPEGLRTQLAAQAVNAADVINVSLQRRLLGEVSARHVVVDRPEGVSTEGGKKARQAIKLVEVDGGGTAVMCGWMDVGRKQAELRSYHTIDEHHRRRFAEPLDFTAQAYQDLMREVAKLLRSLSFSVEYQGYEDRDRASLRQRPGGPRRFPLWAGALIGVLAGVLLAVAAGVAAALLH